MTNKISVIIHTYNNEKIIRECLESVKDFDEIVVCDMYSTDKTLEIAKEYNAKIVMHENIGWADPARNFAIQQASNEWVLVVDSDERITNELREYLYNFIKNNNDVYSALKIPRKNYYWGVFIEVQYPDFITRLIKKDNVFWPPKVHSQPEITGKIASIDKNRKDLAFIHYVCDSPTKLIHTTNIYTDKELDKLIAQNKSFNIYWRILQSFFLIFEKFFFKNGWKSGVDGFIFCVIMGFYKFLMYVKYYTYLKNKERCENIVCRRK